LIQLKEITNGRRLTGRRRAIFFKVGREKSGDICRQVAVREISRAPRRSDQLSGKHIEPEDASVAYPRCVMRLRKRVFGGSGSCNNPGELAADETVSGYRVTTVVGRVEPPIDLKPDPMEVADVFKAPLALLLDRETTGAIFACLAKRGLSFGPSHTETLYLGRDCRDDLILDRTLRGIDR
jgi:hypothetical protein